MNNHNARVALYSTLALLIKKNQTNHRKDLVCY